MNDSEMDAILKEATAVRAPVSPELLASIASSLKPAMRPVKPLAPTWVLASGLVTVSLGVAVASGAWSGLAGVASMGWLERVTIFGTLMLLAAVAATELVNAMIPGSHRRLSSMALVSIACLGMLALFALEFHDYHTEHFVVSGMACLVAGVLHAIPAGMFGWLIMRRGFAVNPLAAGAGAGTVAGLSGITFLELHCTNFEAFHLLLWHTAVLPVSASLGVAAAAAWAMVPRWWMTLRGKPAMPQKARD